MECKDCKFWESHDLADTEDGRSVGWCLRYPPQVGDNDRHACSATAAWPNTIENSWCGEFVEKINIGEKPKKPDIKQDVLI